MKIFPQTSMHQHHSVLLIGLISVLLSPIKGSSQVTQDLGNGVRMEFPVAPQTMDTLGVRLFRIEYEQVNYMVMITPGSGKDGSSLTGESLNSYYKAFVKGEINSTGWQVEADDSLNYQEFPGRNIRFKTNYPVGFPVFQYQRLLMIRNELFSISFSSVLSNENKEKELKVRFFNSLQTGTSTDRKSLSNGIN